MSEQVLVKTIILKASREKVFAYLTKADLLAKWFMPGEADWQEGKPFALLSSERPGEKMCWGEVLSLQEPEHVSYTFTHPHLDGQITTVTITLDACEGGTKLTLVHDGLAGGAADPLSMLANHDAGWDKHFASLRAVFTEAD